MATVIEDARITITEIDPAGPAPSAPYAIVQVGHADVNAQLLGDVPEEEALLEDGCLYLMLTPGEVKDAILRAKKNAEELAAAVIPDATRARSAFFGLQAAAEKATKAADAADAQRLAAMKTAAAELAAVSQENAQLRQQLAELTATLQTASQAVESLETENQALQKAKPPVYVKTVTVPVVAQTTSPRHIPAALPAQPSFGWAAGTAVRVTDQRSEHRGQRGRVVQAVSVGGRAGYEIALDGGGATRRVTFSQAQLRRLG